MQITGSVEIAATPDVVFRNLADAEQMTRWQSDLVSMEPLDGAAWDVGKRFRQVRKAGVRNVTSTAEVIRFVPGRELAVTSDDAGVKAHGSWTLTPSATGTRLDLDFTIEAGGLQGFMMNLFSGAANKQAAKDLQAFKAIVES
jgi:uncharacterized protein YndB with AHSA1/START domain